MKWIATVRIHGVARLWKDQHGIPGLSWDRTKWNAEIKYFKLWDQFGVERDWAYQRR
jgi:hypothetical protein